MKKLVNAFLFIAFFSAAMSCTKKVDTGDFNTEAWLADSRGCNGVRAQMADDLQELKPNLLGHYQKRIIKVLGEPEEQELYRRSQTYYIYYIDPAEDCAGAVQNPRKLEVRFTALGIANEVNIR